MTFLFWLSLFLAAYAYFGYVLWLRLYVCLKQRPVRSQSIYLPVSIIIAARNEEDNLPRKIQNLLCLDYPKIFLQIIIASDGSTDRTAEILFEHRDEIVPVILDTPSGKATALNAAVTQATGEILVFLDARQSVEQNAIAELVSCFADPEIGAVSGELLLSAADGAPAEDALGIYWKIEKVIRKLESATGSVVGVTGAIYAIRRSLYQQIPRGTILDDVYVPMNVARAGKRVVFQPAAIARDQLFGEKGKEFSRKVRTLTGNYQLLRLSPWILSPANPLIFRFLSHKLLRLLVPFFLVTIFVTSALLPHPFYRIVFVLQAIFYLGSALGTINPWFRRYKPIAIANTFVMLNAAAALAFYNSITGRSKVWVR